MCICKFIEVLSTVWNNKTNLDGTSDSFSGAQYITEDD